MDWIWLLLAPLLQLPGYWSIDATDYTAKVQGQNFLEATKTHAVSWMCWKSFEELTIRSWKWHDINPEARVEFSRGIQARLTLSDDYENTVWLR